MFFDWFDDRGLFAGTIRVTKRIGYAFSRYCCYHERQCCLILSLKSMVREVLWMELACFVVESC